MKISNYLKGAAIGTVLFTGIYTVRNNFVVHGDSMNPTLHDGDRILLDSLPFLEQRVKAGGIVLFPRMKEYERVEFVKRLNSLPGDTIYDKNLQTTRVLEDNEYWVLGDNKGASIDSRDFGPVNWKSSPGLLSP